MQVMFTTEEFLEVAIERLSKCDLNPRPLNSVQTIKYTLYTLYSLYTLYTLSSELNSVVVGSNPT